MLNRYKLGLFSDQKLKNKFIVILSGIVMVLAGCLEVEVVNQPQHVVKGTSFHSDVMVEFRKHPDIGTDDDRGMLFAVMKPEAWTIDSVKYMSPEYGDGIFSYLGNAVDEDEEGGIMEGWQDSLEQDYPSPAGMHWQMYLSDQDTTSTSTEADPDSFHVMVHYTVDNALATYDLYYYTTHTNNNDHTDESKADWDNATTTIFDPATPVSVTLQLDMSEQTVSDAGVHVAGSFQGWDPAGTPLSDDDGDGIYSVTIDMTGDSSSILFYKFLNGNSWGNDETVSDPVCGGAGGFQSDRFLHRPLADVTLDPVCWSECIGCDESYIHFQVDMSETPVADNGIYLGGGQWHGGGNYVEMHPGHHGPMENPNIFEVKVVVPEDTSATVYYKFNNGADDGTGYEDGANLTLEGCGDSTNWGDRSVVVGSDDVMLPPSCFSSCYGCGDAPVTANITFQADMSTLLGQGWDNTVHTMELRGGVNGWAGGDVFVEDLQDPNLFTLTKEVFLQPGTMNEWKFKANPDANFNNGGWEAAANRVFEFTGEDMVLDAATPVILPIGELANDVTVQIHATWNMNTMNFNTGAPFAQAPDTIIVNGSFLNCWCTWGDCMGATCATSVSPDVPRLTDPDGNGVYAGTLTLPAGHGNVFTYKLGAYYPGIENETGPNGAMDNEAGFGADKTFYMNTDASGTVMMETVFGDNNPDNPWAHPGGYLANGGFEEGPAGWGSWPPELENWEVTDVAAADGMHSLKISPRTDDSDANPQWTPVYQTFSVEGLNLQPGNYMHMEGHLMTHSSNPITGNNNSYLFIEFFDGGWQQLAKYTSDVVDASSTMDVWHHMMVSGMVPEGSINVNAGCELWQGTDVDAGDAYFDNVSMNVSTLTTEDEEIIAPTKFALLGNYPNPFNPVTTLRFDLDYTSNVSVTVFNILGNEVITLQNGQLNPGTHSLQWNALNRHGQRVPSGLYLYKVVSDARVLTGKMLLMK